MATLLQGRDVEPGAHETTYAVSAGLFNLVRLFRAIFLCAAVLYGAPAATCAQPADPDEVASMVSNVLEKLEADNLRARAAVEASLREENRANRFRGLHTLFRVAVSLVLLGIGGLLVGDALAESLSFMDRFIDAMLKHLRVVSIAGVFIALLDVALDVVSGRPLVGDGGAQLVLVVCSLAALQRARATGRAAVAQPEPAGDEEPTTSGVNVLVAKASAKTDVMMARHEKTLSAMAKRSTLLGWVGLVMGVLHLLLAPLPII